MNTQSNAMGESFEEEGVAAGVRSAARPLYWSVRRELWENRYLYVAPLAVLGVTLFGFLVATIGRAVSLPDLGQRRAVLEEPYGFAMGVIMATTFVVGILYSLDALHGERKDRSILFWKSLPVSDLTTVLSKASIPLVVLPLFTFGLVVVMDLTMLLLSSFVLAGSGMSAATLWTDASVFQMSMGLLYHLVTVHILWHSPIYGWLLLVSGWARRATFLWAALPLLAIGVVEKIAFNTMHFADLIGYRFAGGPEAVTMPGGSPLDPMTQFTPWHFLASLGLWVGLLLAAALLAATVRQRRYQGPI
jgi:ABC-2 type transport system permease protein